LPTAAAMIWKLAHDGPHGSTRLDSTMRDFRTAGTVVAVAVLVITWLAAFRRNAWLWLTIALIAVVLLGPAVQPWYFFWALVPAAAFLVDVNAVAVVGGLSLSLLLLIRPNGTGFQMKPVAPLFLLLGLGVAWLIMRSRARAAVPA
jgi:hypothetical protein